MRSRLAFSLRVTRDYRGHLTVRLKQRKETLAVSESYVHLFKQM